MSAPVFKSLVDQESAINQLEKALSGDGTRNNMTHAWLFTGPPGSGRSIVALAFAAALVCKQSGCGDCFDCKAALSGSHQDVEIMKVENLNIKVDEIREIVSRSNWATSTSSWRVVVVEDSDRMTDSAANAFLKSLEEPGASTVWLLSAPSTEDIPPTILSRCRHIQLKNPRVEQVSDFLVSMFGTDKEKANWAAKLSQGHIGKARALIKDQKFLNHRKETFTLLLDTKSEAKAISAAARIQQIAEEKVATILNELDSTGSLVNSSAKASKEIERERKSRFARAIKDELDGYLLDYISFFRDCLTTPTYWVNEDLSEQIEYFQSKVGQEGVSWLLSLLVDCRKKLATNASISLIFESFFLGVFESTVGH